MSTGMRKWMEKDCPDTPSLPAEVSIDREELRQLRDELAQYKSERDALRTKIEQMEKQEPVAWGAFYFGGKLDGKLYSHCATEAQIDKYIVDRHRSDDSNTFRKAALYTLSGAQPAPSEQRNRALRIIHRTAGHLRWMKKDSKTWGQLHPKTKSAAELLQRDIEAMLEAAPEAKP